MFCGKNIFNLSVVIQTLAFVLRAEDLYLIDSKKVISFFSAYCRGLTLLIKKLFLNFLFGKTSFILIFFLKKKLDPFEIN